MYDYKTIFRYYYEERRSQRFISSVMGISRNTISDIIEAAAQIPLSSEMCKDLTNEAINKIIYPDKSSNLSVYLIHDYRYIHDELRKPGTTINLLWEEYVESAKSVGKPFYHRSYFFLMYKQFVEVNKLAMHIQHKPAERMMVDWDGKTLTVTNRYTGELTTAYLFVATLPFSMKTYVRACPSMKLEEWIRCHAEAYEYFGGVTRLLVPDNLKTGVISNKKNEDIILNRTYEEMANYYDTTIIPARVRSPKDKAAVEGSVGAVTKYLFGRFRNMTFFSFDQLNRQIMKTMEEFNNEPFTKRDGSRNSVFEEEEKDFLKALPDVPFEMCTYKTCKVNIDYHITVDHMNYSVPYEYTSKSVDVKVTDSTITIYYGGTVIASHKRLKGRRNQYSTCDEHMPDNHKLFKWNGERFRSWARFIGENTYIVIDRLLNSYRAEESAYRSCMSILKLSEKYSKTRLEKSCKLALENLTKPGYKNIRMILESNQDVQADEMESRKEESYEGAFVRGGSYYGSKD